METQPDAVTEGMSLPELLQWLERNRQTGNLLINCDEQCGQAIYFTDGTICFVSSCQNGLRLGDFLVDADYLARDEIEDSLNKARQRGICFTQQLLDERLLSRQQLTTALTELARLILIDALTTGECTFRFTTPLHEIIRRGPIQIQTGHLVASTVHLLDEGSNAARVPKAGCAE